MKLFLDANILVSVLNKEYPLFADSSRILSLATHKRFSIFTSPICLAIAWYFVEKKSGTKIAHKKMNTLCSHIQIAAATAQTVQSTLANQKVNDFEDGLEYYAALSVKCDCIITANTDDFYFSEIMVYTARQFCEKVLFA